MTTRALDTLADLVERLGGVPLERIRFRPAPGTATEADLLAMDDHEDILCELVEGTLVQKGMGFPESVLASFLIVPLGGLVDAGNLGVMTGPDGPIRLAPGLVRMPDISFVSWDRLPGRRVPKMPIPELAPNLAVEVLNRDNTPGEMAVKRHEYFTAGVTLVWEADPADRTVTVYTSPTQFTVLTVADTLDGGTVLPGFTLSVATWFARLDRHG